MICDIAAGAQAHVPTGQLPGIALLHTPPVGAHISGLGARSKKRGLLRKRNAGPLALAPTTGASGLAVICSPSARRKQPGPAGLSADAALGMLVRAELQNARWVVLDPACRAINDVTVTDKSLAVDSVEAEGSDHSREDSRRDGEQHSRDDEDGQEQEEERTAAEGHETTSAGFHAFRLHKITKRFADGFFGVAGIPRFDAQHRPRPVVEIELLVSAGERMRAGCRCHTRTPAGAEESRGEGG